MPYCTTTTTTTTTTKLRAEKGQQHRNSALEPPICHCSSSSKEIRKQLQLQATTPIMMMMGTNGLAEIITYEVPVGFHGQVQQQMLTICY
jgi:hypothetical protein